MVFLFVLYSQLSTTLHTNKHTNRPLASRFLLHPNCLLMFILVHKNEKKTFVNTTIICMTKTLLGGLVPSLCVAGWVSKKVTEIPLGKMKSRMID